MKTTGRLRKLADEIELLLVAHALVQDGKGVPTNAKLLQIYFDSSQHKSSNLSAVLRKCVALRALADEVDGDIARLKEDTVLKDVCSDSSCSSFGQPLVWGEGGRVVCQSSVREVKRGN